MTSLTRAVWGPAAWTVLHSAAATCDDPLIFSAYLYALTHILPCTECRQHLRAYLQRHPPDKEISDTQTASQYVYDMHNFVNLSLDKPKLPPHVVAQHYGVEVKTSDRNGKKRAKESLEDVQDFEERRQPAEAKQTERMQAKSKRGSMVATEQPSSQLPVAAGLGTRRRPRRNPF